MRKDKKSGAYAGGHTLVVPLNFTVLTSYFFNIKTND
jgi:hypothetical protein